MSNEKEQMMICPNGCKNWGYVMHEGKRVCVRCEAKLIPFTPEPCQAERKEVKCKTCLDTGLIIGSNNPSSKKMYSSCPSCNPDKLAVGSEGDTKEYFIINDLIDYRLDYRQEETAMHDLYVKRRNELTRDLQSLISSSNKLAVEKFAEKVIEVIEVNKWDGDNVSGNTLIEIIKQLSREG